ncbi:DUF551 domain-containing protein [Acinetobacter sp. YH12112]|uniref:DUF551 domain-containing protein n=1 Tax=Acinetobacter sp. YH12112 TaxID=2601099 RepID=UPI0015D42543|nr:DUF551 domain-containing protein [Acinetobacter sp. YH12112]
MDIEKLKKRCGYDGKPQQFKYGFDLACRELAKAQAVPGWISVEDELPKENQLCVTYFAPAESRLSALAGHCEFGFGLSSFGCRKATHWMPLPDAPQEPAND